MGFPLSIWFFSWTLPLSVSPISSALLGPEDRNASRIMSPPLTLLLSLGESQREGGGPLMPRSGGKLLTLGFTSPGLCVWARRSRFGIFVYLPVHLSVYSSIHPSIHLFVDMLTGTFFTERTIEDHELVIEVLSNWGMEEENKLYFRKNYAKYEFFKNPMVSEIPINSYGK